MAALLPRDEYVAQTRRSRQDDRGQVVNPPTHPPTHSPNHQPTTSQPPANHPTHQPTRQPSARAQVLHEVLPGMKDLLADEGETGDAMHGGLLQDLAIADRSIPSRTASAIC